MLDNPDQVERLLAQMEPMLPLPAFVTPRLATALRDKSSDVRAGQRCNVVWVSYAGDPGGIMCKLDLPSSTGSGVVVASITHLDFDARLPIARAIAAYKKHRMKRLRPSVA
jgi:hypothetical protein